MNTEHTLVFQAAVVLLEATVISLTSLAAVRLRPTVRRALFPWRLVFSRIRMGTRLIFALSFPSCKRSSAWLSGTFLGELHTVTSCFPDPFWQLASTTIIWLHRMDVVYTDFLPTVLNFKGQTWPGACSPALWEEFQNGPYQQGTLTTVSEWLQKLFSFQCMHILTEKPAPDRNDLGWWCVSSHFQWCKTRPLPPPKLDINFLQDCWLLF